MESSKPDLPGPVGTVMVWVAAIGVTVVFFGAIIWVGIKVF